MWLKRSALGSYQHLFVASDFSSTTTLAILNSDDTIEFYDYQSGAYSTRLVTTQVFRDASAWYHLLFAWDTTNATSTDRMRIYVNGNRIETFSTATYSGSGVQSRWNNNVEHRIGNGNNTQYLNGYLADIHFIDGQALTPSSFTEVSATTGQLIPKAYSGTYGTNGFHLPFSDNSTAAALGTDTSGNGNDWTPNNIAVVGSNTVWDLKADGTNWTNIDNAFDGSTSTYADGTYNNGTTSRIRFNTPLTGVTKLRLYWGGTSTYGYNNTTVGTGPASSSPNWVTAYTGTAITVDSVIGVSQAGDGVVRLYAIEVNDSVITGYSRSNPAGNDSLVDTPTNGSQTDTGVGGEVVGNYCTLNPLDKNSSATLTNGNLDYDAASGAWRPVRATIGMSSGKWYWETLVGPTAGLLGIATQTTSLADDYYPGIDATSYGYFNTGVTYNNGSSSSYGSTFTSGDLIGVAFDADNGKIWFSKNGTWQASGDPAAGTNAAYTGINTSLTYFAMFAFNGAGTSSLNWGQRPFAYTAPSGFKALCTANLDAPVVAQPSTVMDVKLYTGNGSTQTISGLGFSPDLVWIKPRNQAWQHNLYDSVRGATKALFSDYTDAEVTVSNGLTAFNSDGFTLGANQYVNNSSTSFVGWTWDAGTTTASNPDGSITSTVRANASAGFSIVTYTGNGVGGATVGHSLGAVPGFFVCKRRDSTGNWYAYHSALGGNYALDLNGTAAASSNAAYWNNTNPSSTVITLSSTASPEINGSGGTYVIYAFAPVAGYSSMGSYVSTGTSDNAFNFCGFKPRFLLLKNATVGNSWVILDSARSTFNAADDWLGPNSSSAEDPNNAAYSVDFLSNGFKVRSGNGIVGNSGDTVVWAAFAESPFQYARAR